MTGTAIATLYKEQSITTRTPGGLVVTLYDGAIKFLRLAEIEIAHRDFAVKGELIAKAVRVIEELNFCLDMESGGQMAQNLRGLYVFMCRHLHDANTQCDAKRVREVVDLLSTLGSAWKTIAN